MRVRSLAAVTVVVAIASQMAGEEAQSPFSPGFPGPSPAQHLTVRLVPSHRTASPGQSLHLAVDIRIGPGWAYYSNRQVRGDVKPGHIAVEAGNLRIGDPLWPAPHQKVTVLPEETLVHNVLEDRAIVYVPVHIPSEGPAGKYDILVRVEGQICKDVCIDLQGITARTSIEVGTTSAWNPDWTSDPAFAAGLSNTVSGPSGDSVWPKLGLALVAGLMLNFMPCVLPIIPLRIHSVLVMAKGSRRRFVSLGLAFAAGVCLFFVAFAVVNVILKYTAGRALNWSEQWQLPVVRIGMGLLVVAVATNLFGAFTVTVPRKLAQVGATTAKPTSGHVASLGMGLMMAVLATPCTVGPLVTVLGWAQLTALWLGTAAIVLLGVGMAAPHAALCALPRLVEKLPRPGRWMELFKQSMAFLLLPLAIFLFTSVGSTPERVVRLLYFGVLASFSLWVWGTWVRFDTPLLAKWMVRGTAAAVLVAGGLWLLPQPPKPLVNFEEFDQAKIEQARKASKAVVIKFTASWCLECKVIDAFVYNTPEVARQLKRPDLLVMKADVSNRHSRATAYMRALELGSPPVTLIYPARSGPPAALPGSLSKEALLTELERATRPVGRDG